MTEAYTHEQFNQDFDNAPDDAAELAAVTKAAAAVGATLPTLTQVVSSYAKALAVLGYDEETRIAIHSLAGDIAFELTQETEAN